MFIYTLHALDKLKTKEAKKFEITKKRIEKAVKTGSIVEVEKEVTTAVDTISQDYSLCVVYKMTGENVKIITFFPVKKGRYERKILQ